MVTLCKSCGAGIRSNDVAIELCDGCFTRIRAEVTPAHSWVSFVPRGPNVVAVSGDAPLPTAVKLVLAQRFRRLLCEDKEKSSTLK